MQGKREAVDLPDNMKELLEELSFVLQLAMHQKPPDLVDLQCWKFGASRDRPHRFGFVRFCTLPTTTTAHLFVRFSDIPVGIFEFPSSGLGQIVPPAGMIFLLRCRYIQISDVFADVPGFRESKTSLPPKV